MMAKRRVRRRPAKVLSVDPADHARAAALRYVVDDRPGIRRRSAGRGFSYVGPDGVVVRDSATLKRIRSLAIPPAWTDVWICPLPNGHLQATGRDARGRKQYRYHPRWRAVRDETKYGRMVPFGAALPRIRKRVEQDLQRSGLPREKVLAMVVRLLETTFIRVGNAEYARDNDSFGLTTFLDRHVRIDGSTIRFIFRGKSGKEHRVEISDRRLARLVRRCRDLPGQDLFQYLDDEGEPQPITSADVNDYIRAISGEDFTAKDFRTWAGTLLAARELADAPDAEGAASRKSILIGVVTSVAQQLGNTVAVCRKCYIHPTVLEAFEKEDLRQRWLAACDGASPKAGLSAAESALVHFLSESVAAA